MTTRMRLSFGLLRNVVFAALLLVLGGVIGYRYAPEISFASQQTQYNLTNYEQPQEYEDVDFQQFWRVWEVLERDYIDPSAISEKEMVHGAIRGMTASLGDPYTMYLPPTQQQRSMEDLQGSFYGVGIQLGYIEGVLAVIAPLKDNPADLAGVEAGDLILNVKDSKNGLDESTDGWSLGEAVNKIRGERGSTVTLTLLRTEDEFPEPFEVALVRDEIVVPSVELSFVDHNSVRAAHIELSRFGERTKQEWTEAVEQVKQDGRVDVVLLDMRNNPGGFFERSIEVASDFIPRGLIVTQQGKVSKQEFKSVGTGRLTEFPVMAVVNRGSASASEIVAGALRDQSEAVLVGENTFGKGTVQDARELENGAGLHVTVARWLLPGGDWIHEEGIPVDVEAEDDPETEEDEVILTAIDHFAENS